MYILVLVPAGARAQTGSRVAFSVNPIEFAAAEKSSAVLSVFNVSTVPLTLSPGDTFTFFFDASVGTLTSIVASPSVTSATLSSGDFAGSLGPSQVTITYSGQAKPFSYGDTVSVEVAFTAGGRIGTGKVSFSSRFSGSVNGNLPYTTVSIVDFANSGVTAVSHDGTLNGDGTPGAPLGVVAGTVAIAHDPTLLGNGTNGTPLGVAVPLKLTGAPGSDSTVVQVTNSLGGTAITATGGKAVGFLVGGTAIRSKGGDAPLPGAGVFAIGGDTTGANFQSGDGIVAVPGVADAGSGNTNGLAGRFVGNVFIGGDLDVGGSKNFKIDHPLDPENKYLVHAAIESSEVLNLYSGNIILGQDGEAVVTLPNWFGALNRDFRYQLTAIGAPGQGLYIGEEINKNQFRIAGGARGMKVSWQVTGVRSDARLLQHPFKAEQEKPERARGTYLAPEAFGQPEEKGSEWSRYPDLMEERKKRRNR
jgi:hypothetical protein